MGTSPTLETSVKHAGLKNIRETIINTYTSLLIIKWSFISNNKPMGQTAHLTNI